MVRLSHNTFVWSQNNLGSLWMQVKRAQDQNKSAKAGEALHRLLPVVIKIKQQHLRFSSLKNPVTEFLNFQASLKGELEFTTLDDNVRKV